jgi:Xaa-Pro dipeptidase
MGLAGFVINAGNNLEYMTGLRFDLMERPVVAFFVPGAPLTMVLPEFEAARASACAFPVRLFAYGEDPATWGSVFAAAAQALGGLRGRLGVEVRTLRVLELRYLEQAAPGAVFETQDGLLSALRVIKDSGEIEKMQRAVDIAEQALLAFLPAVKIGVSELELAAELTLQLLRAGSSPGVAFPPIVASGPNSANPHATPTGRGLQAGDTLVVDWGAACQGYISDLTRTFAVGEPDPEFVHIAQIVAQANQAGCAAAVPGAPAGGVDVATRAVITEAGYGQYFLTRTGHGIGMDVHEDPYMFAQNATLLMPGMTFTVEPGIYIPGRGGVRIEDNVVITATGCRVLSSLERSLRVAG